MRILTFLMSLLFIVLMAELSAFGHVINLSWQESSPANSYNVYRGISSGTETLYDSSLTTSYTDNSVVIGVLYYYEVTAVNAAGESARSNEASAVVYNVGSAGQIAGKH